jgi:hypothetical protein
MAKRVAFRNDYCLACGEARRAVQVRTFDVGHIFYIPILPAGFWKRWVCTVCGRDPHVSGKTRRGFRWAGLVILVLVAFLFWADSPEPEAVAAFWVLRIVTPVGAALVLWHLLRTPKEPTLKARLATIPPAADTVCPFCGAQLLVLAMVVPGVRGGEELGGAKLETRNLKLEIGNWRIEEKVPTLSDNVRATVHRIQKPAPH